MQHSYFFTGFAPVVHRLYWFFTGCTGCAPVVHKNRKNLTIFCNFFLLCINKLEES